MSNSSPEDFSLLLPLFAYDYKYVFYEQLAYYCVSTY